MSPWKQKWVYPHHDWCFQERHYALPRDVQRPPYAVHVGVLALPAVSADAGRRPGQIIRIVRLVRFVSLLNRLYATAMAASAIILPGVTVSHNHAHFFNLLFGGAMLLNFLSCLWRVPAIP